MSLSIVKSAEPRQTETGAQARQELTEGKLRNTLTYIPRLVNEKLFSTLGNRIKGKEKYRLTKRLGELTADAGRELSYAFRRQRNKPQLKVVHNAVETEANKNKIAA